MIDDYMLTDLSPYRLNYDAAKLLIKLQRKFSHEIEEKIVVLINAAQAHPQMSRHQLSLSRKELGDCYYANGCYAGALAQYRLGLELNPRLPVKRRVKELEAVGENSGPPVSPPDMVGDVLQFEEYREYAQNQLRTRSPRQDSLVYDPSWEAEIEARLDALGPLEKEEFYRLREARSKIGVDFTLSCKEVDELTLKAMERSFQHHKSKSNHL